MAAFRICRFANNFHKLSHNLSKYTHQNIDNSSKLIHTAAPLRLREVLEKTEGNVTVIEGRHYESPNKGRLMNFPGNEKHCSLCRLNMDIKYSDVMIISQFVQEDGNIVPRQITGLCYPQHTRMKHLIHKAHRAGLMQQLRPHYFPEEYSQMSNFAWKKYNVYFSELFDHDH